MNEIKTTSSTPGACATAEQPGHHEHASAEEQLHDLHVCEEQELHREHAQEEEALHREHVAEEELLHDHDEHDHGHNGHPDHHDPITVTVNNKSVEFRRPTATGLQIKEAAIAKGIAIQLDFLLFDVTNGMEPVGDSTPVKLHCQQQFLATAPDDNS